MKILSIDWDYFWPSSAEYDWSANETRALFHNWVWVTRPNSRGLHSKRRAVEAYKPTVPPNFWSLITNSPKKAYMAESHFMIYNALKNNRIYGAEVVNIDAHHDNGYDGNRGMKIVSCENWGWIMRITGQIDKFVQFYPEWRKKERENEPNEPMRFRYGLPKPEIYDYVFLCRSGCWAAPWYDDKFVEFYESAPFQWEMMDDMVKKPRDFTLQEAIKRADEWDAQLKQLQSKVSNLQEVKSAD